MDVMVRMLRGPNRGKQLRYTEEEAAHLVENGTAVHASATYETRELRAEAPAPKSRRRKKPAAQPEQEEAQETDSDGDD